MSEVGIYYLHVNGCLLYKRDLGETAADIRESDFAKALWFFDTSKREHAWQICVEGLAAGASKERVFELAELWGCDDKDADNYADFLGVNLYLDGNQWCATGPGFVDLQESQAGFGDTKLEAMSALCLELGYKPSKMWGNDFAGLVRQ